MKIQRQEGEVSSTSNAIKMDDGKAAMVTLKLRSYNPHTSFIIWFVSNWNKAMYECAGVMLVTESEGKEQKNMCNNHSQDPRELSISLDEHRIIPGVFSAPIWIGPDSLTIHPSSATEITWCIKPGNSRMIYVDATFKAWTFIKRNFIRSSWRVRVELIPKKPP